jgi:hypothetical protein
VTNEKSGAVPDFFFALISIIAGWAKLFCIHMLLILHDL